MEFMAIWFTKIYDWVVLVPRWMLLFASGSVASVVIGLLHGKPKEAPAPAITKPAVRAAVAGTQAPSSAKSGSTPKSAVGTARASAPPAAANTDSEHESSAPAKRTSARQRKAKK